MIDLEKLTAKTHHPCFTTFSKYPSQNIAAALGVSPGYYRQVMNSSSRPSPELEEKIHKLATEILEQESKSKV